MVSGGLAAGARGHAANLRGALLMSLSMAGFVANDALLKAVADEVSVVQAVVVRGAAASLLLAVLVALTPGATRPRLDAAGGSLVATRAVCDIGGTFFFLTALFNMPLANATAVLMMSPLAVTHGAALVLGEQVGWRRYTAVAIGFLGVLLIVRPGPEGFNVFALSALAAVVCIAARDILTRRLDAAVPSVTVAFITAVAMTFAGLGLVPAAGWSTMDPPTLLSLLAAGGCVVAGYLFGVMTVRTGDLGFVAPFRYTVLIWALLLGALVFDEIPDVATLFGAAVVVATGLYTLHRERRVALCASLAKPLADTP